jgi:hydroxymethylpyrimidine/phosphomethylpyrimidine kinase
VKTVLSIAGFDPSSGAGVTADLMVFAAHGLFGTSCITALTVQSTMGVRESHMVDAAILRETLACLGEDIPVAGIKIGMLGTAAAVEAVASFIEALFSRRGEIPVVVDPVLRASSGKELLDAGAIEALKTRLLPLADWITPNLDELGRLTEMPVTDREQMAVAADALQRSIKGQAIGVLAKGGHLEVPDDLVLTADRKNIWLRGERVETTSTHGTGCALSSALLCRLVLGDGVIEAASGAKEYVAEAMRRAEKIGHGCGPMNLLWPLRG